jgi:penicillin-binding protein 2
VSERSTRRLVVLQVLVLSLLVALFGRLWELQVLSADRYRAAAADNRVREVVTPAPRGQLLDRAGRPLARNRTALVVSIARTEMLRQPDGGRDLVRRVAEVVQRPVEEVWAATQLCGTDGAEPPPQCWNGSPYQPIPVAENAKPAMALQILERREDFPGVTAEVQAVRNYPMPQGANAAHVLGYLGPVSEEEVTAQAAARKPGDDGPGLQPSDLVGRAGLERQYDADLRGQPGVRRLAVDHRGAVTGTVGETEPVSGNSVVTHLDAKVQAIAERELEAAITRARTVDDGSGRRFEADSGAVVVMDVRTGGILAMASYPSYDPNVWVGGISEADYAAVTSEDANYPNLSRAFQGEYAPASTFKVISMPAAVQDGYPLDGRYECSSDYTVGGRTFRNYESRAYGSITLKRTMEISCDTVFYRFAHEMWQRDGGITPIKNPEDPMVAMAQRFGLGRPTGLDLPGERPGRIADRTWKRQYWEATKDFHCAQAKSGYPDVAEDDPARARFLTQLSRENCAEGYAFRAGDAVNFSIGQGDTTVTPLQLARVYAAIGNGGTLWEPRVGKAVVGPDGTLVRRIEPEAAGRIPVEPRVLSYLQDALTSTSEVGTASGAFAAAGFPLHEIPVASKTGTGEVYGKQNTSWFASYAPADDPQVAVAMVVSQGGTGGSTAGPAVARIYQALFGVADDGRVDREAALLPGGGAR